MVFVRRLRFIVESELSSHSELKLDESLAESSNMSQGRESKSCHDQELSRLL